MKIVSKPAPVNPTEIDLRNPRLYSDGDPLTLWHSMREKKPVHWQQIDEKLGFWSVFKYEDAVWVLKDHRTFTSQRGTILGQLGADDPAGGRQMVVTDPPKHTDLRVPLQRVLSLKAVEPLSESIRLQVQGLLAPALDGGTFDFATAMAAVPMAVTGSMMGLPPEDWPHLTRLTTMAIAPDDPEFQLPQGSKATLERAHREIFAYFQDIVDSRQRSLGTDLLSTLLTLEIDGQHLQPAEVVSNCYSLLLGANVTTPQIPSFALAELMNNTAAYDDWAAHPELIPSGVEEALRWASPANHFMRYTTRDITLRGETINAGEAVAVWLGSANRDEEVFASPYQFDIRRKRNRHIAFGVGPHYCIGHTVARVTLRILFEELFRQFERFESAGPMERLCSNFIAGVKHLPVIAHPR